MTNLHNMATGRSLPHSTIVAAHVFQRTWDLHASTSFEDSDIDNVHNGLLLYKPVECMDRGKIYVGVDPMGSMRFHLLDHAVALRQIQQPGAVAFGTEVDLEVTFGDLDGQEVHFPSDSRP